MSNTKNNRLSAAAANVRLETAIGCMTEIRDKADKIQTLAERIQGDEAAGRKTSAAVHHQHEDLTQELYEMGIPCEPKDIKGLMAGLNLALGEMNDIKRDLDSLREQQGDMDTFETIVHLMETRQELPGVFDRWHISDDEGMTLAHVAARHGYLPDDFKGWAWAIPNGGYTVAHIAAIYGHLPKDFHNWELANEHGVTVAHTAAEHDTLPKGFNRLDLRSHLGTTVAHILAIHGRLPDNFDNWGLCNRSGFSVAHEAAKFGTLPEGFDRWDLADVNGWTVGHTAAEFGVLPEGFDQWHLKDSNGVSVAQAYRELGGDLPVDFDQWELVSAEYRPDYKEDSYETPKMGM